MPHPRERYSLSWFNKKLAFQRVVLVQGARQCGKSFFLRDIFAKKHPESIYVTLDQPSERKFASDNPESFIEKLKLSKPVMIDEAQKVPSLFDAVKFVVDQDPRPGQFVLAGSTEFSIKSNIREALTGRAATLRMFPLTMGEARQIPPVKIRLFPTKTTPTNIDRAELMRHLKRGGMPGMFFIHGQAERAELMADWIQLTTQRDIQQLPGSKKDPSLASDILQQVATLEEPTVSSLAKTLRVSARKINSHVDALLTLFALVGLPPSRFGTGKPRLYLCDVEFANFLGASFKRQLETLYLQELMAYQSCFEPNSINHLSFYRTSKGSLIDFVFQDAKSVYHCVKIHDRESINQLDIRILLSLAKKLDKPASLICAAGVRRPQRLEGVAVVPWEAVCG